MHPTVTAMLDRNAEHARRDGSRFDGLQDGQRPDAVTVCCSDSRVLQDRMWGNDQPGQLFTCSNIGNRVVQRSQDGVVVSGDVLYPLVYTDTAVVVVVGHTGCGAITATYDALSSNGDSEPPGIAHCLELIADDLETGVERLPSGLGKEAAVNRLVEYHVDQQIERLVHSDEVPDGVTAIGAVYDFMDVYSGPRGAVQVVNVDGETAVDALQSAHPEIEGRIERLWED